MLISYEQGIVNTAGFACLKRNEFSYYYAGIVWMQGKKAGEETIECIAEIYEETDMIPFIELFGSFYVVIVHPNGKIILFTDNSHMHSFYRSERFIGTNYLEVVRESKLKEFNKDALCEFFELGNVYFGKTLVDQVELSDTEKYYIWEHGKLYGKDKQIGDIDGATSIADVNQFFEEMAYSLSDLKVTLSLTGGYDSRLVFACLKNHIPVDVFISGNNEKDKDIVYSQKVARAGGCEIKVINTQKPNITDPYINELFQYSQGVVPFLNNGFIRISEFVQNRLEKGYNCYLTGDGGVLHKDWWWLPDFPRYRKKSFDFQQFYLQRIHYLNERIPWGHALQENSQLLQEKMLREFARYNMTFNTQTYDSLYFHVNGKKLSTSYSIHSNRLCTYAPLWERELIRYSYHLPRRKRFFFYSLRKITTTASKEIARIPTNYGTTASSEPLYMIRDIFFQSLDYVKKACRLIGRKLFNKNLFVGNPVTWTIENDIRRLPISKEALDYGIEHDYIKKGTKLEELSFSLLGRLIQVYLLAKFMRN